jgi:hypothetical protein
MNSSVLNVMVLWRVLYRPQQRLTGAANIFERELIHYLVCALGDVLCRETLPDLARYRTRYHPRETRVRSTTVTSRVDFHGKKDARRYATNRYEPEIQSPG